MKRLILFRHAQTENAADSGRDFDRALTSRGLADAALTSRLLSGAGFIPDQALVSAAVRTRQTWDRAEPSLPDVHVDIRPDLYEASAEQLRAAAEAATGRTVLVVAHNPGVANLAKDLAERATLIDAGVKARLSTEFPTAAAVVFELEPGRTACLGVFIPSDHQSDVST